jgi:hypothetical protein
MWIGAAIVCIISVCAPGCLFVRTTEHIFTIREDGTGEGVIHLTDIRSDAITDSLVKRDFDDMMAAYGSRKIAEFEKRGRSITAKRLRVRGDTLMAEITYAFLSPEAIDGLRINNDEVSMMFAPEREVVRTNGKVSKTDKHETHIVWPRDAKRFIYEVREKELPPTVSIAFLYQKYGH